MKKILMIVLTVSVITLTSCETNNNVNSKLEELEQRVSVLENGGTPTTKATKSIESTENTPSPNSSETSNLDMLSFELSSSDPNATKSSIKHTYKVTNNGSDSIEYTSIRVAYYDNNGNCIDTDGRYKDVVIEPEKFVTIDSYGGDETTKSNIAASKVISYTYYLVNPNSNGNNKIEVNCETGKVKESFYER